MAGLWEKMKALDDPEFAKIVAEKKLEEQKKIKEWME